MGNPSAAKESVTRNIGGHEVTISNPAKVLFPKPKYTKLDLVNYYLAVADGALRGAGGRPNMLVRFPNGIGAPSFYQKRAPESRPPWMEVVTLRFPSGRTADEVVPRTPASLAWLANLDRKSTRLNSSHTVISYAVFCLKKKKHINHDH